MEAERLVDSGSMSLPKLEVKTLVHTLTDMLKEVDLGHLASHSLTKKQAKALVNIMANRERRVDFETLNNTLMKVDALPRSRHYHKG